MKNDELLTIEARADWVRDRLLNSAFVYENEEDEVRFYSFPCNTADLETIEGFRKSLMLDLCLPLFGTASLHQSSSMALAFNSFTLDNHSHGPCQQEEEHF
jgi:hypothetical protein